MTPRGSRHLPPPSNLTRDGEFNKYTTSSRIEQVLVDRFMAVLGAALPSGPIASILEIGVGEGHVSERVARTFPDAELLGLDLPHDDIAHRWRQRDVTGVFGDAHRLPFRDSSFDLVLAVEVLEHLPRPELAIAELSRVALRQVVLSVPHEPFWRIGNVLRGRYLQDLGNTPDHIQHWTPRSFRHLVQNHLDILEMRLPPPWILVTATPRGRS